MIQHDTTWNRNRKEVKDGNLNFTRNILHRFWIEREREQTRGSERVMNQDQYENKHTICRTIAYNLGVKDEKNTSQFLGLCRRSL